MRLAVTAVAPAPALALSCEVAGVGPTLGHGGGHDHVRLKPRSGSERPPELRLRNA